MWYVGDQTTLSPCAKNKINFGNVLHTKVHFFKIVDVLWSWTCGLYISHSEQVSIRTVIRKGWYCTTGVLNTWGIQDGTTGASKVLIDVDERAHKQDGRRRAIYRCLMADAWLTRRQSEDRDRQEAPWHFGHRNKFIGITKRHVL